MKERYKMLFHKKGEPSLIWERQYLRKRNLSLDPMENLVLVGEMAGKAS